MKEILTKDAISKLSEYENLGSISQLKKERCFLENLIAYIDLIMHDKDYRFRNPDGTWYSRESCRDLTIAELENELFKELRNLQAVVECEENKN